MPNIDINRATLGPLATQCLSELDRHCVDNNINGILSSLQSMNQLEPENHELWFHSGLCHYQLKKHPEAINAFHQAVKLEPHEPRYALNLALVYQGVGNLNKAIHYFEIVQSLAPDEFIHYAEMGQVLCKLQRIPEARRCYNVALDLNNNSIQALIGLAQLEQLEKNFSQAIELYERVIKLAPKQTVVMNNLGFLILERNLRQVLG